MHWCPYKEATCEGQSRYLDAHEDIVRLCRWAYAQQGWAPIAALAPLVMGAARAGDAVASQIIGTAADQAAGAVAAVVARCGLTGMDYVIVLSGAPTYRYARHRCDVHPRASHLGKGSTKQLYHKVPCGSFCLCQFPLSLVGHSPVSCTLESSALA